ncbi:MAG: AAA family ATPase [Bdellovibrionales bacterium]|nr:AAA family ATPase [Bdellovibrionales bacterium]
MIPKYKQTNRKKVKKPSSRSGGSGVGSVDAAPRKRFDQISNVPAVEPIPIPIPITEPVCEAPVAFDNGAFDGSAALAKEVQVVSEVKKIEVKEFEAPRKHGHITLGDLGVLDNSAEPNKDDFGGFDELIEGGEEEEFDFLEEALKDYLHTTKGGQVVDGTALGLRPTGKEKEYVPDRIGFRHIGSPEEILQKLEMVGYVCQPFIASQIALLLKTELNSISAVMMEGPSGCGKSFLAKSLAKITGAELLVIQCYKGMEMDHLIEKTSEAAVAKAMAGSEVDDEALVPLGTIAKAFQISKEKPVILLIDEIDKADWAIDTFFLGPIQDGIVRPATRPAIEANRDNLLIMFTKNMERPLNDALLRRVQPIKMDYMKPELEERVLGKHCASRLVENLINVARIMRYPDEAYPIERAPAPEELLKTGKYVTQLLTWHITDYAFIGKNIWYMLAKSEKDRETFENLLRFHPRFQDPLVPDNRNATQYQIFARLGRFILEGIVEDPMAHLRKDAYEPEGIGWDTVGTPEELTRKLADVGYQSLPFVSRQIALLLNTPTKKVRTLLLEGPSGCGKSFMAKCLTKIVGAEMFCLSCYPDMDSEFLVEKPSQLAMLESKAGTRTPKREELVDLGVVAKAFLKSKSQPVLLLIDEIDKVGPHLDTFFLGPLQDGTIWCQSRPPIDANVQNLLVVFTKNMNRTLDQALLRRVHPIRMTYLDSTLERNILNEHCHPQLVANLVAVADRMRASDGSYEFERPPAPEELLTAGHYLTKLIEWGSIAFDEAGRNIWAIIAKSEHDRAVLEHMLRFHPDFEDPLCPDNRNAPIAEIQGRLGRWVLRGLIDDPLEEQRHDAWFEAEYN